MQNGIEKEINKYNIGELGNINPEVEIMGNSKFSDSMRVDPKDLIPTDSLEMCTWVMEITAKARNFAIEMEGNEEETGDYANYYYSINHYLGECLYQLEKEQITKEEFTEKCKKVYENFKVVFDVLRQNMQDLEGLEKEDKQEEKSKLSARLSAQYNKFKESKEKEVEKKLEKTDTQEIEEEPEN